MNAESASGAKRVEDLLERYVEHHVVDGVAPDPEELCRDDPELLETLREYIREYERVSRALDPLQDLELGQIVLHYWILAKLGEGGMGQVYLAQDQKLGRQVALKLLPPEMARSRERLERFRREARAVAALNHPNIITIHAVEDADDLHFLTMELVEGTTLDHRIGDRGTGLAELFDLAIPIADALSAAHDRGIIHRDLKPTNVMVGNDGQVKILDFGLAKHVPEGLAVPEELAETLTQEGRILGTFPYMSPEQIQGETVDVRSDIFSFGIMLYEMSTGRRPFRSNNPAGLISALLLDEPPPVTELNKALPARWARIIERCLEKDPDRRWQSAQALAHELRDLQRETESATALPSALTGIGAPQPAAHRWRMGAAVLLAATFLIATILLLAKVWAPLGGEPTLTEFELLMKGRAALERFDKMGNLDLAIASFQEILGRNAEHAAARAGLAKAFWLRFRYENKDRLWLDRAEAQARRAVELEDYLATAHVTLGLVLTSRGEPEAALEEFQRALDIDPSEAEAFRGIAEIHRSEGRNDEAETFYRKAIELAPERREYHDLLGALLRARGRYAEAATHFQKSIELAPDGAIGYSNLASIRDLQDRLPEATQLLQQAIAIEPKAKLFTNLGNCLFAQSLFEDSVEAFQRAIDLGGASNHIWLGNLADGYRWTNRPDDARKTYSSAILLLNSEIEARPHDVELQSRLAVYLAKRGDVSEALATVEDIDISPKTSAATLGRLVLVYDICGQRDLALAALSEALRSGYPLRAFELDPELLDLRSDPGYLLLKVERKSEASREAPTQPASP